MVGGFNTRWAALSLKVDGFNTSTRWAALRWAAITLGGRPLVVSGWPMVYGGWWASLGYPIAM
jgi:hypothetical protein